MPDLQGCGRSSRWCGEGPRGFSHSNRTSRHEGKFIRERSAWLCRDPEAGETESGGSTAPTVSVIRSLAQRGRGPRP